MNLKGIFLFAFALLALSSIFIFAFSFLTSSSYAAFEFPSSQGHETTSVEHSVFKNDAENFQKWFHATSGTNKLSKDDIRKMAIETGLFKESRCNPQLAMTEGDISFWYEQHTGPRQMSERMIWLEFISHAAVLKAADQQKNCYFIPTQGDLTHMAKEIMFPYLAAYPKEDNGSGTPPLTQTKQKTGL